jgi:hypothetical protein
VICAGTSVGRLISSSSSSMLGFGHTHSALGTCHLSLDKHDENIHTKVSIELQVLQEPVLIAHVNFFSTDSCRKLKSITWP